MRPAQRPQSAVLPIALSDMAGPTPILPCPLLIRHEVVTATCAQKLYIDNDALPTVTARPSTPALLAHWRDSCVRKARPDLGRCANSLLRCAANCVAACPCLCQQSFCCAPSRCNGGVECCAVPVVAAHIQLATKRHRPQEVGWGTLVRLREGDPAVTECDSRREAQEDTSTWG
jgi:hypothetical protein